MSFAKYGADHVAQIVTFGTMAARAAVRDVGRALGYPYAFCDRVAKMIPHNLGITIDRAMGEGSELRAAYDADPEVKTLIDMARKAEGMPRHASTHAAGVVITDRPVTDYVPLAKNEDAVVTQYTMTALEELGTSEDGFSRAAQPDRAGRRRKDDPGKSAGFFDRGHSDGRHRNLLDDERGVYRRRVSV